MKIYSRIIPENGQLGQKKTPSQPKETFEDVFGRVLRSERSQSSSAFSENQASLSPELAALLETVLNGLEALLSSDPSRESVSYLREGAQELFEEVSRLPAGPSRDLLEELALLGVVEAEKRLA